MLVAWVDDSWRLLREIDDGRWLLAAVESGWWLWRVGGGCERRKLAIEGCG